MNNSIVRILKEQIKNWDLIYRMASFEIKSLYQNHYLGILWQFISPAIQIAIYWFVFGIGLRGGEDIDGTPFFLWLIIGLIPWFFISPTIIQSSNSIYQKLNLVSKMKFPVSLLPTVKIVSNSFQFFIMTGILLVVVLLYNVEISLYIVQYLYYLICLYAFLFSFSLFSSTLATIVRDYQLFLQSMIRMLLYLTPILWDTSLVTDKFGPLIENILKLNPLFYIIDGFRSSILGGEWFFEDISYTLYFWAIIIAFLYFGSRIHMRFRKDFVDYL